MEDGRFADQIRRQIKDFRLQILLQIDEFVLAFNLQSEIHYLLLRANSLWWRL
jgi:hypothetical protein